MKKTLFFFMLYFLIITCENNTEIDSSIQGKWNVTQIIGGFAQPVKYEPDSFTWSFNFDTKTVTIVNISQPFDTKDAPTFINNRGGIYPFEIITENNIEYLVVGDRKGAINFTETDLTIDYGIAFDDIAYIFNR